MKLFVLVVFVVACGIVEGGSGLPPNVAGHLLGSGGRSKRASASAGSDREAPVLRSESVVKPDGYNWAYETGNGIFAESSGSLKSVGDGAAIASQGQYKYTSPDGTPVALSYVADENGYQPVGDHIPQPPPIPEAILRSLEYIKAHPAPVENAPYRKP